MFSADDVKGRIKAQPFTPLRIITSAGDKYDVFHPDLIMVGRRYVIVGTASEDNPTVFERTSQIPLLHIAAIESSPAPGKVHKNGE